VLHLYAARHVCSALMYTCYYLFAMCVCVCAVTNRWLNPEHVYVLDG